MSSLPLPEDEVLFFVNRGEERRKVEALEPPFITEDGLVLYERRSGDERRAHAPQLTSKPASQLEVTNQPGR
ncbi:hypothetical protein GCM10007860_07820 [Chitiniphilus shinanonensis]|uniref:Uncharacterized protein n=1 Tax=Chitiniphilus shinanonensis TaxID=553088 RepID=A0ABQ6BTU9_9NEIS|nr:hypothetical protein [Chitiniphilus shinanonensis]GLS03637.1 hypothetical protein GCM10007860_07820 [Chitiniphilus shinanonensis]